MGFIQFQRPDVIVCDLFERYPVSGAQIYILNFKFSLRGKKTSLTSHYELTFQRWQTDSLYKVHVMYQNNQYLTFRDTMVGRLMTQSQFKSSHAPPSTHPLPSQAVYLSLVQEHLKDSQSLMFESLKLFLQKKIKWID